MSSWKCIKSLWNYTREEIKDFSNQILGCTCYETFRKLRAHLNELWWLGGGAYFMIEQWTQPPPPPTPPPIPSRWILLSVSPGLGSGTGHIPAVLWWEVLRLRGMGGSLIPCVVSGSGTLSLAADLSCENLHLPPAARPSHLPSSNSSQAVTLHGRGASTHTTLCFKGTALNFWLELDGRERDNTCFFPMVGLRWLLPQAG